MTKVLFGLLPIIILSMVVVHGTPIFWRVGVPVLILWSIQLALLSLGKSSGEPYR